MSEDFDCEGEVELNSNLRGLKITTRDGGGSGVQSWSKFKNENYCVEEGGGACTVADSRNRPAFGECLLKQSVHLT